MKTENQKQLEGTQRADRKPGRDLIEYLEDLPNPNRMFNLDATAKKWYRFLGAKLLSTKRLAQVDIPNLVLLAQAWALYAFAQEEINKKNKKEAGSGYIQVYASKATNITTEYKLRSDAIEDILKISKLFGMSFKDRHSLNGFFEESTGQLDLFDAMNQQHPDNNPNLKVVGQN